MSGQNFLSAVNGLFVFGFCASPFRVKLASALIHRSMDYKVWPLLKPFVKQTVYRQFCGGETLEEVKNTIQRLRGRGLSTILDYPLESVPMQSPEAIIKNQHLDGLVQTAVLTASENDSKMALKVSSIIPYEILRLITFEFMNQSKVDPRNIANFSMNEKFRPYVLHLERFVDLCVQGGAKIIVDAEQLEIQPAIDHIVLNLCNRHNKTCCVIESTYQLYLQNSLERLSCHIRWAQQQSIRFGFKIVRGAYLGSDRSAPSMKLYGPIFSSKEGTDNNFNEAILFLANETADSSNPIQLIIASHNRESVELALNTFDGTRMKEQGLISFAQLYGMGEGLFEIIQSRGFKGFKYLPYGPVDVAIPYLLRRTEENSEFIRNHEEYTFWLKQLKAAARIC